MLDDPLARRYFVMNTFDGILTVMGLVIGGALTIKDPLVVFKTGMGTSLAIMISGFFGAYMTERTEQAVHLHELEKQLLHKLDGTMVYRTAKKKVLILAAIDGISPFLGALLPLIPFLLAHFGIISFGVAFGSSVVVAFMSLGALGIFLGKTMGENIWKSSVLFMTGGILIGILGSLIEKLL